MGKERLGEDAKDMGGKDMVVGGGTERIGKKIGLGEGEVEGNGRGRCLALWGRGGWDDWKNPETASYTGRNVSGRKESITSFPQPPLMEEGKWRAVREELGVVEKGENCKTLRSQRPEMGSEHCNRLGRGVGT